MGFLKAYNVTETPARLLKTLVKELNVYRFTITEYVIVNCEEFLIADSKFEIKILFLINKKLLSPAGTKASISTLYPHVVDSPIFLIAFRAH